MEGGGSPLAADEAAACSCLFFSWNLAARSLSRWIFLDDFFLLFSLGDGFRLHASGLKCVSLGFPRKTEKFTKASPFTDDSMDKRDLLLDFQHFVNSRKVESRKASSVKFVFVRCIFTLFDLN